MNLAAPVAPALYVGRVMHHRMKPKVHRFQYDVFTCLIDLDRLDEVERASPVFSVDRFNLIAFHQCDHGGGAARGLADHIRAQLAAAGAPEAGATILLSAYPRILGFVFNPIAVYYCHDKDGRLAALVYEVSNTFGERQSYVAPVGPGERDERGVRQSCDKTFHVSPFLDMAMRYRFRLAPPDTTMRLRILEEDAQGPILAATYAAERRPFTTSALLAAFLRLPLMTLKVIAAIHWEALRLWIKGVAIVPRPSADSAAIAHPGRAIITTRASR
jgi:DUF1365 family protein